MSNTSSDDIIALYKSANQLLVVFATEYKYVSAYINPQQYPADRIFDVVKHILEHERRTKHSHHKVFYKLTTDSHWFEISDFQLMQLFGFATMDKLIPLYADSTEYVNPSEEINEYRKAEIKKELEQTTQKLRDAFNAGLYAYNLLSTNEEK